MFPLGLYLGLVEDEADRLLRLSPDEFQECFRKFNFSDLSRFLESIRNRAFKAELLRLTDSETVYLIVRRIEPHTRAELLNLMNDTKRHFVVRKFTRDPQAIGHELDQMLECQKHWQELEGPNCYAGILPLLVWTGELPAHYPSDMETCVICKDAYNIWDSVITADCLVHSFCTGCHMPGSRCPVCTD
ncbi:hypothetical protein K469DRAFT_711799 [Zopfia rhizophila CBS 207.26]|uniref:Uncharacterized protein n=1 Tax=Zopfia rhizophila CBS 207.26 TaxID=1314779 RepID=A0A6A6DWS7_9PEZI|nr:hypothetical protein K469DRAFT_711799 [Zopfia rhizophila CBS 207.26]